VQLRVHEGYEEKFDAMYEVLWERGYRPGSPPGRLREDRAPLRVHEHAAYDRELERQLGDAALGMGLSPRGRP